jgi:hypothetical protein
MASTAGTKRRVAATPERRRKRGSGGVVEVRPGVWKVDVEIHRDAISGARRRVSRQIRGTREEAELALARLRVADHERRLPTGGTKARSVRAAFELYLATAEAGVIELAPRTLVTSRSARNVMCSTRLPDGREFGGVRLSALSWQDIEHCFGVMRREGRSAEWIRRCGTV